MSTEITLHKEASPIVEAAVSFEITNDKTMAKATEMLSQLNTMNDRATKEKERITRPLLDALAVERGRWKPFETDLAQGITALRQKLTAYRTEQKRIADEEADKIAARVGQGKGKLKPETAIAKIEAIDQGPAKIETESGSLKFRTVQQFEVQDVSKVPHQYLLVNEPMVRAAMKDGLQVPGIRYYTEEVPINSRAK